MGSDLITTKVERAGKAADAAAGLYEFERFRMRLSQNTIGVYHHSIELFEEFLSSVGVEVSNLESDPSQWKGISYGLCVAFQAVLQKFGYSANTINNRMAAVKIFAKYAHKAGYIDSETYTRIRGIEALLKKVDDQGNPIQSNIHGARKVSPNFLSDAQLEILKAQPLDTPVGRRNAVLMCILCDHGLRIGEALDIQIENIDLTNGLMTFYRKKVKKFSKHRLTKDTLKALALYLKFDRTCTTGPLLVSSRRDKLTSKKLSKSQAFGIVRELGRTVGVSTVSPHDARHSWARRALDHGTTLDALRDGGGWCSYAMPLLYVKSAAINNEGVKLD